MPVSTMTPCHPHSISLPLLFKSVVGFSVVTLALVEVTLPELGVSANLAAKGTIVALGAILGALLARKA